MRSFHQRLKSIWKCFVPFRIMAKKAESSTCTAFISHKLGKLAPHKVCQYWKRECLVLSLFHNICAVEKLAMLRFYTGEGSSARIPIRILVRILADCTATSSVCRTKSAGEGFAPTAVMSFALVLWTSCCMLHISWYRKENDTNSYSQPRPGEDPRFFLLPAITTPSSWNMATHCWDAWPCSLGATVLGRPFK